MRKNTDFSVFFAFLVGSTGLVRSGATEQRLLHDSVNRVTAGESWRKQKKETLCLQCRNGGGEYRARTCDPLLVRQMLSQLS